MLIQIFHMDRQLRYFQEYHQRVQALIRSEETKGLISQAFVLSSLAAMILLTTTTRGPPPLLNLATSPFHILSSLSSLSTGQMGCAPADLAARSTNSGCSAELEHAADLYNP